MLPRKGSKTSAGSNVPSSKPTVAKDEKPSRPTTSARAGATLRLNPTKRVAAKPTDPSVGIRITPPTGSSSPQSSPPQRIPTTAPQTGSAKSSPRVSPSNKRATSPSKRSPVQTAKLGSHGAMGDKSPKVTETKGAPIRPTTPTKKTVDISTPEPKVNITRESFDAAMLDMRKAVIADPEVKPPNAKETPSFLDYGATTKNMATIESMLDEQLRVLDENPRDLREPILQATQRFKVCKIGLDLFLALSPDCCSLLTTIRDCFLEYIEALRDSYTNARAPVSRTRAELLRARSQIREKGQYEDVMRNTFETQAQAIRDLKRKVKSNEDRAIEATYLRKRLLATQESLKANLNRKWQESGLATPNSSFRGTPNPASLLTSSLPSASNMASLMGMDSEMLYPMLRNRSNMTERTEIESPNNRSLASTGQNVSKDTEPNASAVIPYKKELGPKHKVKYTTHNPVVALEEEIEDHITHTWNMKKSKGRKERHPKLTKSTQLKFKMGQDSPHISTLSSPSKSSVPSISIIQNAMESTMAMSFADSHASAARSASLDTTPTSSPRHPPQLDSSLILYPFPTAEHQTIETCRDEAGDPKARGVPRADDSSHLRHVESFIVPETAEAENIQTKPMIRTRGRAWSG